MSTRPAVPLRPVPPPPLRRTTPSLPSTEPTSAHGEMEKASLSAPPKRLGAAPPPPPRRPTAVVQTAAADGDAKARLLARQPPPRPVPPLPKRQPSMNRIIAPTPSEILPVPPPPPRPAARPPPLPERKPTQDSSQKELAGVTTASQTTSEAPARRRLPPPLVRGSTPPPPPPVNKSTKPILETPSPSPGDCCIKCYDFSGVDHHASRFPKHTISNLPNLARDLTEPFASETEKARVIFAWLSHNIVYDVQAFMSGNIQAATPEGTVRSGRAVCDGYAGLFMHLLQLAGIRQVSKVTGHGKGYGYQALQPGQRVPAPEMNHAWNRVCLDGEWRLIDPCWGAGALCNGVWDQRLNPYWFTADAEEFGKQHFPTDSTSNQCLARPISWEEYITEPARPSMCGDFHTQRFSVQSVQPAVDGIPTGGRITFSIAKSCLHQSRREEENYLLLLWCKSDNSRTPLTPDNRGGWSATIYVPQGSGVALFYVKSVNNQDAKGLTVQEYQWACGRQEMSTSSLVNWQPA